MVQGKGEARSSLCFRESDCGKKRSGRFTLGGGLFGRGCAWGFGRCLGFGADQGGAGFFFVFGEERGRFGCGRRALFCLEILPSAWTSSAETLATDLRRASMRLMTLPRPVRGLVLRDGQVLELGVDEFLERDLVAIDEFGGVERGGALLDERLGEVEGVFVDGDLLDVAEVFGGLAQLFLRSAWCRPSCRARSVFGRRGGDGEDVLAAAEGDLAEAGLFGLGERGADDGEGFGLDVVLGHDEVGLLEVLGREFVERDELLDLDGVLGGTRRLAISEGSMMTYWPLVYS